MLIWKRRAWAYHASTYSLSALTIVDVGIHADKLAKVGCFFPSLFIYHQRYHYCTHFVLSLKVMTNNGVSIHTHTAEREYDTSYFHNQVQRILIDDHNVPKFT